MENKTKGDFFMKRKLALALAMMMGISSLSVTAFAADDSLEDTGKLTLYYSNSTEWADPIIQEFEDQTGIEVSLVQDGTSSLFARIKAEAGNPQADVVWGGVIDTYRANQDLLQEYTSSEVDSLKPEAVDPNGYYTGFDMGPMVMIYNTELVQKMKHLQNGVIYWMRSTKDRSHVQIQLLLQAHLHVSCLLF